MVVPSPNWPYPLYPQAQTVPSLFSDMLRVSPLATATTPDRLLTPTAVLLPVFVPLPNWPYVLSPQLQTFPADCRARFGAATPGTAAKRAHAKTNKYTN